MISVEAFAAKDHAGKLTGVMLVVPVRSGLQNADYLRLDGSQLFAVRAGSVLPIDLPPLDAQSRAEVETLVQAGRQILMAEFTVAGLVDAFLLRVEVAE